MGWREVAAEWTIKDIGAPLLASLAEGLYDAKEVLREYMQNAVDSYVDFQLLTGKAPRESVRIFIDDDAGDVHVMDDGIGMDRADILRAKSIAVSHKLERQNEFVGFRGIGIWAGLSACQRLVLETTKVDVPCVYRLTIEFGSIRDQVYDPIPIDNLLQGKFRIEERDGHSKDHYTHVRLEDVRKPHYADLLHVKEMSGYVSEFLPVSCDPEWTYTSDIERELADLPEAKTFDIRINGNRVYKKFPPVYKVVAKGERETLLKKPEAHIVRDKTGRVVARAWSCETNRRGQRKAIEVDHDLGEVNSFGVRIKNFQVGKRGFLADPARVADADNLGWYVGEIYITDTDIRPDTNRRAFQRSFRSDEVTAAIQQFYTEIATSSRGWSAEVAVLNTVAQVNETADHVQEMLAAGDQAPTVTKLWKDLNAGRRDLLQARQKANAKDTGEDSARVVAERKYLRKEAVRDAIKVALHRVEAVQKLLQEQSPETVVAAVQESESDGRRRRSKAQTANLKGVRVSPNRGTERVASTGADVETPEQEEDSDLTKRIIETVARAFLAAAAAVLGEDSEAYAEITDRLPVELQRRGLNV